MTVRECMALAQELEGTRRVIVALAQEGDSLTRIVRVTGLPEAYVSWVISTAWREQLPAAPVPQIAHRVFPHPRGRQAA